MAERCPQSRLVYVADREGDILSLDLGVIYNGFCSDMAVTLPIGSN